MLVLRVLAAVANLAPRDEKIKSGLVSSFEFWFVGVFPTLRAVVPLFPIRFCYMYLEHLSD